jgi:site-specific DNA recombinase
LTRQPRQRPQANPASIGSDVWVGVYVRRSTDDEHQPYSIEAQDARLAAYISSQPGWRQAARFADDASGATTSRHGLQRALASARAGAFDVLLVYRVDRLTRSLRDLVTLLDDLDQAGAVFRLATEPFDTATAMGRMLVQMLGMLAQFERDTIIDRVIAGMERKAAAGKWKGGRRPYGYQVDASAQSLVPDPGEAAIVRLIFESYARDRRGARNIASLLNERGHRTTAGGRWSAHQVLRVLVNRVYLGDLAFRGITTSGCHTPVIEPDVFDDARRLLAARGEGHAKRAASGSDYLLTGLIRCPSCGSAMLGTRAHGRTRTYRYYTCYRRTRYDSTTCGSQRIDADAIEDAMTAELAAFYRDQHGLIAAAITKAQASHTAEIDTRHRELAAAERELARTSVAIDRYLAAFENGTLNPEDLAGRLAQLKTKTKQLAMRRDELAAQIASAPAMPPPATFQQVADHIDQVIGSGTHSQRKALVEALVAQVKITGPGRIVPVFRIPQPDREPGPVRAMTNLVGGAAGTRTQDRRIMSPLL